MELDLNFPDSIYSFSKQIKNQFDKIDILVDNAGMYYFIYIFRYIKIL